MSNTYSLKSIARERNVVVMGSLDPSDDAETIAGVDLATYAWVVKQIAPLGYDQSLLPGIAAQRSISAADWRAAMDGWALRIEDPEVASAFRRLYDSS